MNYLIWTYLLYAVAAIGLTAILAKTLFTHGTIFLETVFEDRPGMAAAINRLLVTGFYMLNLGYALLIFQTNGAETAIDATEVLVTKLGLLLVSLGVIHFVNMAVFWRIQRHNDTRNFTPAMPSMTMPPPPAADTMPFPV
jgi:hypothetical protein